MTTNDYHGPDRRTSRRAMSNQAQILLHLNREIATGCATEDAAAARWLFARNLIEGRYDPVWESENIEYAY